MQLTTGVMTDAVHEGQSTGGIDAAEKDRGHHGHEKEKDFLMLEPGGGPSAAGKQDTRLRPLLFPAAIFQKRFCKPGGPRFYLISLKYHPTHLRSHPIISVIQKANKNRGGEGLLETHWTLTFTKCPKSYAVTISILNLDTF